MPQKNIEEIFKDRVPSLKELNSDINQSEIIQAIWKQILELKAAGGIDDEGIRELINGLGRKFQELEESMVEVHTADTSQIKDLFND